MKILKEEINVMVYSIQYSTRIRLLHAAAFDAIPVWSDSAVLDQNCQPRAKYTEIKKLVNT